MSVESVREVLLPVEPVAREVAATEHHAVCASRKGDECNCFKRSTIYLLADAVLAALAAAEEPGASGAPESCGAAAHAGAILHGPACGNVT